MTFRRYLTWGLHAAGKWRRAATGVLRWDGYHLATYPARHKPKPTTHTNQFVQVPVSRADGTYQAYIFCSSRLSPGWPRFFCKNHLDRGHAVSCRGRPVLNAAASHQKPMRCDVILYYTILYHTVPTIRNSKYTATLACLGALKNGRGRGHLAGWVACRLTGLPASD